MSNKKRAESDREYRQTDKGKACTKRYNESEKGKASQVRFLEKTLNTPELREKRIERLREWRQTHQLTYAKVRKEVMSFLGNKCVRCGIDDFRVLQIDHINGNGYQERKQFGRNGGASTVRYYRHILDVNGEGYQLLCANCNWIKRYEQSEQN